MIPRAVGLVLGMAASLAAVPADAETDRPVFVVVVGHGAIRLRLAAGITAPCDSTENRMLFDGWVGVGRYALTTRASFVCYEHTSGALREADWSLAQLVATANRRGPAEIRISTD
jgi:hypothetical protein